MNTILKACFNFYCKRELDADENVYKGASASHSKTLTKLNS